MKARGKLLLAALGCLSLLTQITPASDAPLPLRILYIGDRAAEFQPFLNAHFAKVESTSRAKFQPQAAKDFDVVLLDWPQSALARQQRLGPPPLGTRDQWSKPTVLLGSAGLNLAVAWKVKGWAG
jgi:hypothetical protein